MIKVREVIKKFLRRLGYQLVRLPKQHAHVSTDRQPAKTEKGIVGWADKIAQEPLNASLHLQYAVEAFKKNRPYLSFAELKTAEYLGADRKQIEAYNSTVLAKIPKIEEMNHNQYYRLLSLSSAIVNRGGSNNLSILDVGGGQGELASFIPEVSYCLAEPTVNGISGTNLPFKDQSFDYVVSCHVLEHIPPDSRELFMDQLLSKARRGVILLNPFYVEGTHVENRLALIIEVTGAGWAREHIECNLPRIETIRDYARQRGLKLYVEPNGTLTTSLAMVFIDYFGTYVGIDEDHKKINRFFNLKCKSILDSGDYPTAYLIHLARPE